MFRFCLRWALVEGDAPGLAQCPGTVRVIAEAERVALDRGEEFVLVHLPGRLAFQHHLGAS